MTDKVEELWQCNNCKYYFNQIKYIHEYYSSYYVCNSCWEKVKKEFGVSEKSL